MSLKLTTQFSKIRGCNFGGALGDTVGLFTEFLPGWHCVEVYGPKPRFSLAFPPPPGFKASIQDQHRARFERGAWTDDTDQSLLLLLSFLRSGGREINPIDFAKRLRVWVEGGLRALDRLPLGIGRTVGGVVGRAGYVDDPVKAATDAWVASNRFVAANGAVMRTAVIGALLFQDRDGVSGLDRVMTAAIQVAATTHADPRCLISCAIVSRLVAAMLRDEFHSLEDIHLAVSASKTVLQSHDPPISEEHLAELDAVVWAPTLEELKLDERQAIGYTYKCLGSGTWALRQAIVASPQTREEQEQLFERLITELTMQGGDADTNCAVAGSLLGAYFGIDGLPKHWLNGLRHSDWLMQKCDAASYLLGIHPTDACYPPPSFTIDKPYNFEADQDTLIDAGKGPMTKEKLDAELEKLYKQMSSRIEEWNSLVKGKGKPKGKDDSCVIT